MINITHYENKKGYINAYLIHLMCVRTFFYTYFFLFHKYKIFDILFLLIKFTYFVAYASFFLLLYDCIVTYYENTSLKLCVWLQLDYFLTF